MNQSKHKSYTDIFKKGSTTYFTSSIFFPKKTYQKISILYAWVRTADNFVDSIPQQPKQFYTFCKKFENAWNDKKSTQLQTDFVHLAKSEGFEKKWIDAFLQSMESDLFKTEYTFSELKTYMYGSAEVVGLMMSRIMKLDKKLDSYAQDLGRAMQLINFIRDVKEDKEFNRTYLKRASHTYISYYKKWDERARKAFAFIPYRYRVPIKTAEDMYLWTANKIEQNPDIPLKYKLKPSKCRIIFTGVYNAIIETIKGKDNSQIGLLSKTKS